MDMRGPSAESSATLGDQLVAAISEVGTLATNLAGRIVGESLDDEARQGRVVERFLAELETPSTQAPGAN